MRLSFLPNNSFIFKAKKGGDEYTWVKISETGLIGSG